MDIVHLDSGQKDCEVGGMGMVEMSVVVSVPVRCQWALTSSAQSNNNVVIDIVLLLGMLVMVCISLVSFFPSFLTSCMPLLVVVFTTLSSRGSTVGLGNAGWWLTVGDQDGWVLVLKLINWFVPVSCPLSLCFSCLFSLH